MKTNVAGPARPGGSRGASTLGVQEGQVAGHAGEVALVARPAGVVDEPGLERRTAAEVVTSRSARHCWGKSTIEAVVTEPVATGAGAAGLDGVAMRVSGQQCHYARI